MRSSLLLVLALADGCSAGPTPGGTGGSSNGGSSPGGSAGTAGSGGAPLPGVSVQWVEPAAGATLTGTARFRFSGHGFLNVEVKRDGATISYCTVSADRTSALCDVNTTQLPNGAITRTAHAWDSPPGTAFTHDADAGPRTFTVANTPTPPSGWGDFIGVCAYTKDDFPLLQSLGIKHVRYDRPSPAIIDAGRQYGIEVLPIANYGFTDLSGQSSDKYPPLPEHRATWAKRMVDTWRGMSRPPPVIEVWNEPWHVNFWKPRPHAGDYLELVKAFAREAWAVWPNVTLLVSADWGDGTYRFREELLKADTAKFLTDRRILPTTHNYVEGRPPNASHRHSLRVGSQPLHLRLRHLQSPRPPRSESLGHRVRLGIQHRRRHQPRGHRQRSPARQLPHRRIPHLPLVRQGRQSVLLLRQTQRPLELQLAPPRQLSKARVRLRQVPHPERRLTAFPSPQ